MSDQNENISLDMLNKAEVYVRGVYDDSHVPPVIFVQRDEGNRSTYTFILRSDKTVDLIESAPSLHGELVGIQYLHQI